MDIYNYSVFAYSYSVTCVTSRPPFDQTTQYLATKTFVGVVPAIIIEL